MEDRLSTLRRLENEVCDELKKRAEDEHLPGRPVTDGVVNEELFLACTPKMLWLLKEPWDTCAEEDPGGGWSVTKHLIPRLISERTIGNKGLYARMAWITYSVLNGYEPWQKLDWISENPGIAEALLKIAYINISKYPGKKTSYWPFLQQCYEKNRSILLRQITTIAPDVVIGGGTLSIFFKEFGLAGSDFAKFRSVKVCRKEGRLYIDAYHPSCWWRRTETYVDDIVAAIKQYREKLDCAPAETLA